MPNGNYSHETQLWSMNPNEVTAESGPSQTQIKALLGEGSLSFTPSAHPLFIPAWKLEVMAGGIAATLGQ